MARILITGGPVMSAAIAPKRSPRDMRVSYFDNLLFGHREFVRWGPLIEGDIRDAAALDAVFSAYRVDAVMHFAALAYVGEFVVRARPIL